jgi:hypothetical protein
MGLLREAAADVLYIMQFLYHSRVRRSIRVTDSHSLHSSETSASFAQQPVSKSRLRDRPSQRRLNESRCDL